MNCSPLIGPLLQILFTDYLLAQKRVSLQTLGSYRGMFRLLLRFVHRETGVEPADLTVAELHADIIAKFLDSLQRDRSNSIASRNLRLTAIRSFYRMVALRDPANVEVAMRVLAVRRCALLLSTGSPLARARIGRFFPSIFRGCISGKRPIHLQSLESCPLPTPTNHKLERICLCFMYLERIYRHWNDFGASLPPQIGTLDRVTMCLVY